MKFPVWIFYKQRWIKITNEQQWKFKIGYVYPEDFVVPDGETIIKIK